MGKRQTLIDWNEQIQYNSNHECAFGGKGALVIIDIVEVTCMGAWNYMVFDDDTAYDALDDLKASSEIVDDMERYFDEVIQAEYVGYDEGHYALVSAAIIDSVINDIPHRCDNENYFEWTKSLKRFDFTLLKQKAVKAIDAVIASTSELKELWEENKELYSSWREDKVTIQERLR